MTQLKISTENTPSRLFDRDLKHVKRKIKEAAYSDPRFKDKSAAVRYYVRLGILTELRTKTANNLDDKIIKAAQKEVVIDSLLPLKNSIDSLRDVMRKFDEKQDLHFQESYNLNDKILKQFQESNEKLEESLGNLLKELSRVGKINEESLRNAIVLRSVMLVFLLGYKTGRIEPKDKMAWEKLVPFVVKKAQELSIEEIQQVAEGAREHSLIVKMANEMWSYIKEL